MSFDNVIACNDTNVGDIYEYESGKLEISIYKDGMEKFKQDNIYELSEILWALDLYGFGEWYCLGNSCQARRVYNYRMEKMYIVSSDDLNKLENGETLILTPCEMSEQDKIDLEEWQNQ